MEAETWPVSRKGMEIMQPEIFRSQSWHPHIWRKKIHTKEIILKSQITLLVLLGFAVTIELICLLYFIVLTFKLEYLSYIFHQCILKIYNLLDFRSSQLQRSNIRMNHAWGLIHIDSIWDIHFKYYVRVSLHFSENDTLKKEWILYTKRT